MRAEVILRRGGLAESRHRVHVAVVDADGLLIARAGDPGHLTHVRSAAKPLQAIPLVEDGVVGALGIPSDELAITTGSHGGEEVHVATVRRLLERAGVPEAALDLGPHAPMSREAARALVRSGDEPRPVHNNCSGKHAGMLALARHHGWSLEGYRRRGHPVQERVEEEVVRWTGLAPQALRRGVDGCGVVAFGMPLVGLARGFSALGRAAARGDAAPEAIVGAMTAHPRMVAGRGRLCTVLMEATGGSVFGKTGAEGVYAAGNRAGTLGVALKVEGGYGRAAEVALVRVLEELGLLSREALEALAGYRPRPVPNTLGEEAAVLEAVFSLEGVRARPGVGGSDGPPSVGPVPGRGASTEGDDGGTVTTPATLALVRVSGALATRDEDRIRRELQAARKVASPARVEEALVQAYLFLGFPAALNALSVWRELGGDGDPAEGGPDPAKGDAGSPEAWERRGEEVCARVYGDRYEALRENIRGLHPDLDRWMVMEGYGKVLGRPGLDLRVRELCIVGLLAVLDAPVQLYSHLRGALSVGAAPEEVEAALAAVDDLLSPEARERSREQWARVRSRRERGP